jgi:hypothetical protein
MIALVPWLLLGGLAFLEQPIDGLDMTNGEGLDPRRSEQTWRCADMDGDGAKDILTPGGVAFQRNGVFPRTDQTPFPKLGEMPRADVWKNEVIVLLPDRIESLRWSQGEWQRTLSQPIAWANSELRPSDEASAPAEMQRFQFDRFLHDINDDGKPEIILVSKDGLRVYARGSLFYEEKTLWPVFPKMQPLITEQTIWPANARTVEIPILQGDAEFSLNKRVLTVYTNGKGAFIQTGGTHVFKQIRYNVAQDNSFAISEKPESQRETEPLSAEWSSISLNDDDVIDLVRVRYVGSTSSPYPVSKFEVAVSTDGGKTIHTAQCTGAYPSQVIADFNRDGRLDLVTESKQLVEGGIKETLVRGFTRREVDLEVEIRFQDSQGGFPGKPSIRRRFGITLDKPPANLSEMFLQFLDGQFLKLNGDVDGDRLSDAVIHDRPDALSVYRGNATGITNNRIATLSIEPTGTFRVVDIDEDGRDDILVRRAKREHDNNPESLVYLSRDIQP